MEKQSTEWVNEESRVDADGASDSGVEQAEQPIGQGRNRGAGLDLRIVRISMVRPHALNPRLCKDEELIAGVQERAKERGTYDETQPLIVREVDEHFELLSGHHRLEGYERAGLSEVLVHVVQADAREAMLALERYNRQNPLGSLELALHASNLLDQGIARDQAEAAELLGLSAQQLSRFLSALRVFRAHQESCAGSTLDLRDRAEHLYMLRALPRGVQEAMIKQIIEDDLSKTAVKRLVDKHKASKVVSASSKASADAPVTARDGGTSAVENRKTTPEAATHEECVPVRVDNELAPEALADVQHEQEDLPREGIAFDQSEALPEPTAHRASTDVLVIELGDHVNTIHADADVTLHQFPGPLPGGMAWHVKDGRLCLAVPQATTIPGEDQGKPLPGELPASEVVCEPTRETVTLSDPKVFETLPTVAPTGDLLARLSKLGVTQSNIVARELGTSDVYEAVFGKKLAAWFRGVIDSPSTKAKETLRKLKVRHTEKVVMTTPRHDMGGRPVVLLLDEQVLGLGVYDKLGKAPCGHIAVLVGNHVVFVDADQLDCEAALVFLDHKPGVPNGLAGSESRSAV